MPLFVCSTKVDDRKVTYIVADNKEIARNHFYNINVVEADDVLCIIPDKIEVAKTKRKINKIIDNSYIDGYKQEEMFI